MKEGGIPIGVVLVENDKIVGRGHNRLLQYNFVILHGEMDCFENSGRLKGSDTEIALFTQLCSHPLYTRGLLFFTEFAEWVSAKIKLFKAQKNCKKRKGWKSSPGRWRSAACYWKST
ncbi:MAG: hypothetical protein Q8N08_04920 [Methanobacteriaceae archaeon]|nr:hypothetical protein [Methanobacteriaceae archaeon]